MTVACRVCLQVGELMINIFEEDDEAQSDLSTLLERCGGIKVCRDDNFPKFLCKECTSELLIASKFRDKCERSLQQMTEMLKIEKANEELLLTDIDTEIAEILDVHSVNNNTNNVANFDQDPINEFLVLHEKSNTPPSDTIANNLILVDNETEHMDNAVVAPEQCINDQLIIEEELMSDDECPMNEFDKSFSTADSSDYFDDDADNAADSPDNIIELGFDAIDEGTCPGFVAIEKPKVAPNYVCDICGAVFRLSGNLKKHIETTHMTLQLFTCDNCEHCFSEEATYIEHCEKCTTVTNINGTDSICSYCGKRTANSFALNMHLRTHTGERPFPCTHCNKKFKTQSALNTHMKRHSGMPEFPCTVCNKAFYESSNLRMHMRSHTGEKPHICTVCQKSFSRVFLLQTHMRTHTGERPYGCRYCDSRFAQSCDLKNHELLHTGEKRYKCQYCDKSYNKKYTLERHMSKHTDPAVLEATNSILHELADEQSNAQMTECSATDYYSSDGIDIAQL